MEMDCTCLVQIYFEMYTRAVNCHGTVNGGSQKGVHRGNQMVNLSQGDTHRRVSGSLRTRHPNACRQPAEGSRCDEHGMCHRVVEDFSWHMHVVDKGDGISPSVIWITWPSTHAGVNSTPACVQDDTHIYS